jgi:thiol-disulfide isomerase/thioredoxin
MVKFIIQCCVAIFAITAPGATVLAQDQPARAGAMREFRPMLPRVEAPELSFVDAEGKDRGLSEFRGKLVLLNLWATWCAPCVREMPSLERLQAKLGGDRFTVLALSQDRGGLFQVRQFYEAQKLKGLDIFVDKTMASARAIKAPGLPTTLLIDPEGREIGRLVGATEWDAPESIDFIQWYLRGVPAPNGAPNGAPIGAPGRAPPAASSTQALLETGRTLESLVQ